MEKKEQLQILAGVFGAPYTKTNGDLNGIPVVLRTLYDTELQDALKRSLVNPNIEMQLFLVKRWKLAYSLISVNTVEFPTDNVEESFGLIAGDGGTFKGWPNYYVEQVYALFEDACLEESELTEILKKSSGVVEAA